MKIKRYLFLLFLCIGSMLQAQTSKTVNVTAGNLYASLTETERNTVTELVITGTIDARDFRFMRDKLPHLSKVDLSAVAITDYTGINGTFVNVYANYPANSIPGSAFQGFAGLTSITIPQSVTKILDYAFLDCTGLISFSIPSGVNTIGQMVFANCARLSSVTVPWEVPPGIDSYVFYLVDRNSCTLHVPYGTTSKYRANYEWNEFKNIVETLNGLYVSANSAKVSSAEGSITSLTITANVAWKASSDQTWLVVSPSSGTANNKLTFTAQANTSISSRTAKVTVSSPSVESKTITITQSGADVVLSSITAGSLSASLTADQKKTLTNLTIKGTIDARDFLTMRDKMPLLTELDLSGVTIVAYQGSEGTISPNTSFYPANTIPEEAFVHYIGSSKITNLVLPGSVTAFGEHAFDSGLTSLKLNNPLPVVINESNVLFPLQFNCTVYVPYGSASRYATADFWKNIPSIKEAATGFNLSSYNDTIAGAEGTTYNVDIKANVAWSISSEQDWLTVSPTTGNGNQKLTFTASANKLFTKRQARVTITATGVSSQVMTIVQDIQPQPEKILELTAGALASALNTDELNTISILTLKGTIDARDFKTMRDKMPLLASLDLSGVNIVAYSGTEGTSLNYSTNYPANSIPETAFLSLSPSTGYYCGKASLKSIVLPSTLNSLGYFSFGYCTGIRDIAIPSGVTSIGENAFYHCDGLISVSIPKSVKSIESSAFRFCASLSSVIIPSSITSIGSSVFADCGKLTTVTVNWQVLPSLSSYLDIFYNVNTSNAILNVPYGTSSIYSVANQWKEFKTIKEMPGFLLSAKEVKLKATPDSVATLTINSNVEWTVISDQSWLSVSPGNGNGLVQKLSFTAEANPLFTPRIAQVTVSSPGIESQTIVVTQMPAPSKVELTTAGGLATTLTEESLKEITDLTITGTIDARDFKTIRDKMPLLAKLDISGANIVAYNGDEGTRFLGGPYAANAIPETAFYNKISLVKIELPKSITMIERDAFSQCNGLIDIVIPEGVTKIDRNAFYNCKGLKTVILPSSLITLGIQSFRECSNLTSLTINNPTPPDLLQSAYVFYRINKSLCVLNVPYGSKWDYRQAYQWMEFMNIVEPANGFYIDARNVRVEGTAQSKAVVNISSNIEWTASTDQNWLTISPGSGSSGSQSIIFSAEENPSYISARTAIVTISSTVSGVASLKITVTQSALPQPPKTLEITAGELANALTPDELATITDLTLTGSIDARDFKTMRDRMPLLAKLNVSGVTIVAYTGTEGTTGNETTVYPQNTIPDYAFIDKANNYKTNKTLSSLILPESLTAIGHYSFAQCSVLQDVIIPQSVKAIGTFAFYGCSTILKMNIPSSVENIGVQAFGYLNAMISIDTANPYFMIANDILFNKAQTKLIQCVASINGSYEIPSIVTTIGDYAFYNRDYMTSVTIPSSVAAIGTYAFAYCDGLKSIYANSVVPINLEASPYVFSQVYGCTLYVPIGSKTAYQTASQWRNFFNIIEINPDLIANAGFDKSVDEGQVVTLEGTVSTNTSGKRVTFKWTAPEGITLNSDTIASPTFTAPEVTYDNNYRFSLVISDGLNYSAADEVYITVRNTNKPPVANAGKDQTVNENSMVFLDGSASYDPDNNSLYYEWIAPYGLSISPKNISNPSFKAPEVSTDTNFTILLKVHDGYNYQTDTVVITVKQVNKAPIAYAGNNQYKEEGELVILDGGASMDPDGDALTYLWTSPAGVVLSSATSATPSFTAPEVNMDTYFTFTLTVTDKKNLSSTSEVTVMVRNIPSVLKLVSYANNLPEPIFLNYKLFIKQENSFIQKIDTFAVTGEILYMNLEAGEWIVLASPARDPSAFVPTYSGDVLSWKDAKIIRMQDKSVDYLEIKCKMPTPATTGMGQISGFVYEKDLGGTKNVSMYREENVQVAPSVPNVIVRLYKKDDFLPVASFVTDATGFYIFDKLAIADYEIVVEMPGFAQSEKFPVMLSVNAPATKVWFAINTSTQVITDNNPIRLSMVKAYPNPTNGIVHISGLPEKAKIAVYTLEGKLILKKNSSSTEERVDITNQVSGTYVLVVNEQRFKIFKK